MARARSCFTPGNNNPDRLREWAHQLENTQVHNKAAVAVANKLACIVWAVWTHQTSYGSLRKAA
jgi:transposase